MNEKGSSSSHFNIDDVTHERLLNGTRHSDINEVKGNTDVKENGDANGNAAVKSSHLNGAANDVTEEQTSFLKPTVVFETGYSDAKTNAEEKKASRHRILHTICIFGSVFAMGWTFGMMGPSFPDLRLIIKADLGTGSWVFTGWSLGELMGCLFGGIAYDRFNKIALFVVVNLGQCLSVCLAPWCAHFVAMVIIHVFIGFFGGVIKTACTADIAVVWREKSRSYLQLLYGIACVGAIIGPLVADPFLARKVEVTPNELLARNNLTNSMEVVNSNNSVYFGNQHDLRLTYSFNYSKTSINRTALSENHTSDISTIEPVFVYGETRIHIPYAISGASCGVFPLLFVVVTGLYGSIYQQSLSVVRRASEFKAHTYKLSPAATTILTVMIAAAILFYLMLERGMTQFTMTFVLRALDWSRTDGSIATGLFWATIAGGRISSVFVINRLKTPVVLAIYLVVSGFGELAFCIGSIQRVRYPVFIAIGICGWGMSIILGALFSVLSERVRPITGKISSAIFVTNALGGMVVPLIIGNLIEDVAPISFVFVEATFYCIIIIVVTLIFVMNKVFVRREEKIMEKTNENTQY